MCLQSGSRFVVLLLFVVVVVTRSVAFDMFLFFVSLIVERLTLADLSLQEFDNNCAISIRETLLAVGHKRDRAIKLMKRRKLLFALYFIFYAPFM